MSLWITKIIKQKEGVFCNGIHPLFLILPYDEYFCKDEIKVILYPHCSEEDKRKVGDISSIQLPALNFIDHIQPSELDNKLRK